MPSRPDMTLVIRTQGLLVRADVLGGGTPDITAWRRDFTDAGAAVAFAFSEAGKPGKRVWVLDSSLWLGTVDLPAGAVAGQTDKDLAGPAAYEAEAFSDLSPLESVTAVQRRRMSDQGDQFLVTQARRADLAAVTRAVRSAGARLAGLGHPAGLPQPLEFDEHAGASGDWRRVEFWYDAVVLVESVSGRVSVVPLGVGPRSDWRRALSPLLRSSEQVAEDQTLVGPGVRVRSGTQWRETTAVDGTARWLAAGEDQQDEDDGVPAWDLADDAAVDRFAKAWAQQLAASHPGSIAIPPTLRPPKAPASRWPAIAVGVLALALAVLAVVSLRQQSAERLTELQQQIEHETEEQKIVGRRRDEANQAKADVRNKQRIVDDLGAELKSLQRQLSRSQKSGVLVDRRAALSEMMASVSDARSDATVIRSIEHGSPRHEIAGMATSPDAATRLARRLSEQLRGKWAVSPAQIEMDPSGSQVVWRFTIVIEPAFGVGAVR